MKCGLHACRNPSLDERAKTFSCSSKSGKTENINTGPFFATNGPLDGQKIGFSSSCLIPFFCLRAILSVFSNAMSLRTPRFMSDKFH